MYSDKTSVLSSMHVNAPDPTACLQEFQEKLKFTFGPVWLSCDDHPWDVLLVATVISHVCLGLFVMAKAENDLGHSW